VALAGVLGFCWPSFLAAQERGVPVFSSEVELITVDAVVLDNESRPVRGLEAADFVIEEDGKRQVITSFEAIDLGALASAKPAPPASPVATNLGGSRAPGRSFVILVDDLGLAGANMPALATALARLLEDAFDAGNEVTLGSTSGSLWWSVRWPEGRDDLRVLVAKLRARKVVQSSADFMSDWEAYRIDNFEGASDIASGTSRPGAGAAAPVVSPGTDLTARVVRRWTETSVCAPENPGLCAQMVRMRARERNSERRDRTRATMAAVERAIFSLTGVRGRKELLLFSEGFLHDVDLPVVKQVAGACREANIVVNFVDARGLIASIEESTASASGRGPGAQELALIELERVRFEADGSAALAEDTGGLAVTSTNDLAAGARRIVDESRVYYLLGYQAPPGKGARDWRKVDVEVRRPGVRVRTRKGYVLRPPPTADSFALAAPVQGAKDRKKKTDGPLALEVKGGSLETARALTNSFDADGIPLRAMAYVFDESTPGKGRVLVAIEADMRGLDFRGEDKPRATLDLTVVAASLETGTASRADQRIEVYRSASGPPGWSLFTHEFELAPGVTQARVVVRDQGSGRLGAVTARFEVPPLSGLRLSTPILTDQVSPGSRPQPVLAARRAFKPSGILYCQFQVLGAAKDAEGTPRVDASYVLRLASGVEVRSGERKPIAAVPGGPVMRLLGLPLDGLPGGDYELVLRVVDTTSGRSLERAEPFRLESPSS
jgi:VWFA-related protein